MKSKTASQNLKLFAVFLQDIKANINSWLEEAQECMHITTLEESKKQDIETSLQQAFQGTLSFLACHNIEMSEILSALEELTASILSEKTKKPKTTIKDIIVLKFASLESKIKEISKNIKKYEKLLANINKTQQQFPAKDTNNYQNLLMLFEKKLLYFIAKTSLSTQWKVRKWPTYLVKDSYQIEGQQEVFYNFDKLCVNSFVDTSYMAQHFDALPDKNLGTQYEHSTVDGHITFQNWLKQLCADRRNIENYSNYSSYYNWSEEVDYKEEQKQYKAYKIHNVILVDKKGQKAPVKLTEWLFKDDVNGNVSTLNGIATREDVYKNWKLEQE